MLSLNNSFKEISIFLIAYIYIYTSIFFYEQLIREINLHSDSFDGDIVQAIKSSFTKLIGYLDHEKKENIIEGNTFY